MIGKNRRYRIQKEIIPFLILVCFSATASAVIKLPAILSDGVILQRDKEINLTGWADVGEEVKLEFKDQTYNTRTGQNGEWLITLPAEKAGGPFDMIFKGENEIKVSNVLFGDVWLCSGQSNMVLTMERVKEKYPDEIANASYPEIRNFFVSTTTHLNGPLQDLSPGEWKDVNPKDVLSFSAVAYFFAKKIYSECKIPIGIINSSVGGTPIEAWISEEGFSDFPELLNIIKKNKDSSYVASQLELTKIETNNQLKDNGLLESPKWFESTYTPKGWYNINIPGYWEDQGVRNLDGVVWYRKEVTVPETMTGVPAKLFMGRIVDADVVYINGEKIGNTTYRYPPRRYDLEAGILKQGKNTIIIRVSNYSGKGGFVPDKPYFLATDNQEIDLKGTWQYKVGEVFESNPNTAPSFKKQDQPSALYNAMIAPLINRNIKGFLWYQGETNASNPEPYFDYLSTLVSDWRIKWTDNQLPFLFVQLANFTEVDYVPVESKWAELRNAQMRALSIPNTAMAVAIDLGEWNDIHPLNKKDVGERLALGALKLAYQRDIVYSGPIYQSFKIEGEKIVISFNHVGHGLTTKDGEKLRRFEIAGEDGVFKWAKAQIVGEQVEVWNESVEHPKQVRYAWSDNPRDANLYNMEGLPASPFETMRN